MKLKIYYTTVAIIFSVVATLHLVRVLKGWEAVVEGVPIPLWVSWVAFVIAGYLAVRGFQFSRRQT